MTIAFLAYPQCSLWSLIGSCEILQKTCRIAEIYSGRFQVRQSCDLLIVSSTREKTIQGSYGNFFGTDKTIYEIKRPDILVIPGFDRGFDSVLSDCEMIEKIREFYNEGTDIATVCTGSFILAATGLLDNKIATTHWLYSHEFTNRFPKTELVIDRMMIDHDRICMSGGASSFQNLMIYLVEKYISRELAIFMTKLLLIDNNRFLQSPYTIFNGQKTHGDESVLLAQQAIEKRTNEFITIDELAQITNMSKRNFLRRFKQATGDTPFVYMQRTKVEAAKTMMDGSQDHLTDIALKTGYNDFSSFRKSFKKYTGIAPQEYRKKYTYYNYLG
ncbi:MAG TPA: helix-turn-helix domain-containing protein [Bacteroidales bacterium]|nr:helix-turn-helix domain-containing protein [Bacteroidales bacterium]